MLERIQRRSTKLIPELRDFSSEERLKENCFVNVADCVICRNSARRPDQQADN